MSDPTNFTTLAILLNIPYGQRKRMFLGDENDIELERVLTLRERVIVNCLAEGVSQRHVAKSVFRVDEALISRELKVVRTKVTQALEARRKNPLALLPHEPTTKAELTDVQLRYLQTIQVFEVQNGRQPSFGELGTLMGRDKKAAVAMYTTLMAKGWLQHAGSRVKPKKELVAA